MIYKRLKELREEKGLLQKNIAEVLKITTSAYGFYEQGRRDPDTNAVQELADFYNVSTDYILGHSDVKKHADIKASLDVSGLPEEAIKQIEDYIKLVKFRYSPDGSSKNK